MSQIFTSAKEGMFYRRLSEVSVLLARYLRKSLKIFYEFIGRVGRVTSKN